MKKLTEQNNKLKKAHRIDNPVGRRLLTLKEAAAYLGRSVDSMRELIYSRSLPVIQLGERSKVWIDIIDLDAWIEQQKKPLGMP
jgi:excisionase family DNA binding protein